MVIIEMTDFRGRQFDGLETEALEFIGMAKLYPAGVNPLEKPMGGRVQNMDEFIVKKIAVAHIRYPGEVFDLMWQVQRVPVIDRHGGRKLEIAGKPLQIVQTFFAVATGDIVLVFIFQSAVAAGIHARHDRILSINGWVVSDSIQVLFPVQGIAVPPG